LYHNRSTKSAYNHIERLSQLQSQMESFSLASNKLSKSPFLLVLICISFIKLFPSSMPYNV